MGIGIAVTDHTTGSIANDLAGLHNDGPERLIATRHRLVSHADGFRNEALLACVKRRRRKRSGENTG